MKDYSVRPSRSKLSRSRAVRPVLEDLEGRILLYATTGDHFTYGSRITWSIVPDGTNLGGVNSNLVSTLNNKFGAGNWQQAIQDAFAVWENVANVNLVQVSDDGEALDAGNLQQGNSNFGDIRISGFSQNSSVLGFTILPPPANGGSDSGDIFLNSSQAWQLGSNYDLESVMIHEIGHALGMGHSADTSAAMYPYYHGVQQYVDSDDVAGIQSIWSARQEDGFALGNSNFTASHAANITPFINGQNQDILGPLDVASSSESYWFKVTTPANASSYLSAAVQSTYLSELSPRVQIYNSNLQGLVQTSASANSYGAIIGVTITNATPNTTYYIRVSGSNGGSTGTGAYALLINMGNSNPPLLSPPNTQVQAQPDQGGGGTNILVPGSSSSASPVTPNPSPTPVSFGPVSATLLGIWSQLLGWLQSLQSPTSANQWATGTMGAWENIHSFSNSNLPGTGSTPADLPETIQIGGNSYNGDFLLTTPPPSTSTPAPTTSTADAIVLIPLDPSASSSDLTVSIAKKTTSSVTINAFHPVGPV